MKILISRIEGHAEPAKLAELDSEKIKAELQAEADKKAKAGNEKPKPVSDGDALREMRERADKFAADHRGAAGNPPQYRIVVEEK